MIFLGLKFWPKVIFWGHEKKQRDFLGGCKTRTKGFGGGYTKKSSDFFG